MMDALTRYYHAKEREESAVLHINDSYLEALNALERLEAENVKLRELAKDMLVYVAYPYVCVRPEVLVERAREMGIEVDE